MVQKKPAAVRSPTRSDGWNLQRFVSRRVFWAHFWPATAGCQGVRHCAATALPQVMLWTRRRRYADLVRYANLVERSRAPLIRCPTLLVNCDDSWSRAARRWRNGQFGYRSVPSADDRHSTPAAKARAPPCRQRTPQIKLPSF